MQNACPFSPLVEAATACQQFATIFHRVAMPAGDLACMRFPILLRLTIIAGVALALLVPLFLIRGKVTERQARADAVQRVFAEGTSGPQVLARPLLALTCEETD